MNLKSTALIIAICALANTTTAQEAGDVAISVGMSSFGVALQGEYTIDQKLRARGVLMGGFSVTDTFEEEGYTIDGKAELGGVSLLADYYPTAGAWRVTGGLFISNSNLTGDFVGPENFSGEMKLKNELAPMLTTGFNASVSDRVAIYGDVGVVVSSLEVSSDSNDPDVQDEIDNLNHDLEELPVVPYLGFGVSFNF